MKRRANESGAGQEQQPRYKIYVKMMKTVPLGVKSTDTVDQIKSTIGAIEGVDKSHQMLFFAGNQLENNKRLADYNIMTNSSVDLYVTDGMQLYVKIPSVGKIIRLNVKKSHSVADVKYAIEEEGGIPLDEQILMYAGQQLEDNKLLSQCGLSNGQTLHVLVCPTNKLCISINVDGERTLNLDVKSWYTIADVKLMIETMERVPARTQILVWTQSGAVEELEDTETPQHETEAGGVEALGGSETLQNETEAGGLEVLEDYETLRNLNIGNNDVLTLYHNVQVFVRTYEGRTLTLSVRTCDTAYEVLKKVEEKLQIKSGIYYLLYRGRVLYNNDTLQHHNIGSNATIHVRLRNTR